MNYENLESDAVIETTINNLKERNIEGITVNNKEEAFEKIKSLIPPGSSVMNGSSTTLNQIGYIDYLKGGAHGWNNLHEAIVLEKDPIKQRELRNQALFSDFYLGSAHAIAQTGEMVIASNSGSQLPHLVFTSKNIILVVSTKKITSSLEEGMKRVREHVFPLEDARMKSTGASGSAVSKMLLFEKEPSFMGRKVMVIFVKENLGF